MGQVSAFLLYDMYTLQTAYFNGTLNDTKFSFRPPPTEFSAPPLKVWVSALWLASLALSLTMALIAVLVKQWLHHYRSIPSGTPRDRALARQYRFDGFKKWHVPFIIGFLPFLMLLALAIFFLGLILLLSSISMNLGIMLAAIAVAAYATYIISILLPVVYSDCPYQTPLSKPVHKLLRLIVPHSFLSSSNSNPSWTKFNAVTIDLAARSLHWLYAVSVNSSVRSIVLQSFGGMPPRGVSSLKRAFGYDKDFAAHFPKAISDMLEPSPTGKFMALKHGTETRLERLLRSALIVTGPRDLPRMIFGKPTSVELRAVLSAHHTSFLDGGLHPSEIFTASALSLHPIVWEHILRLPNAFPTFMNQYSVDLDWWNHFIPQFQPPPLYRKSEDVSPDIFQTIPFSDAIVLCRPAVDDALTHLLDSLKSCCTKPECRCILGQTVSPWLRFLLFILNHTAFHTLLSRRRNSGVSIYSRQNTLLIVRSLECLWQGLHGLSGHHYTMPDRLMIFQVIRRVMGGQVLTDSLEYSEVDSLEHIRGLTLSICAELSYLVDVPLLPHHPYLLPPPYLPHLIGQAPPPSRDEWLSTTFLHNISRLITPRGSADLHCSKGALDIACQYLQYGIAREVQAAYDEILETDFIVRFRNYHAYAPVAATVRCYVRNIHFLVQLTGKSPIELQPHIAYLTNPETLLLACAILGDSGDDVIHLAALRRELPGPSLTVSECVEVYMKMDGLIKDEVYFAEQYVPRGDPYEWVLVEDAQKKEWKGSLGTVAVRLFMELRKTVVNNTWMGPKALDPAFWDDGRQQRDGIVEKAAES